MVLNVVFLRSAIYQVFGDILLIGMTMDINNWEELKTGDDAYDATFFNVKECPVLAFECHQKIFEMYINRIKEV